MCLNDCVNLDSSVVPWLIKLPQLKWLEICRTDIAPCFGIVLEQKTLHLDAEWHYRDAAEEFKDSDMIMSDTLESEEFHDTSHISPVLSSSSPFMSLPLPRWITHIVSSIQSDPLQVKLARY